MLNNFFITAANTQPIYLQLYTYIKNEIINNNISANEKLPSIRQLSKELGFSKNTISAAYEQLVAEGYITSRDKSGYYVESLDFNVFENSNNLNKESINEASPITSATYKYDFSSGQIDLDNFPYLQFKRILSRCIDINSNELLLYGEHTGDMGLKKEIAKYIYSSRGVKCNYNQIIISAGTQQSLLMLSQILLNISNALTFEEPGYLGSRLTFEHMGFNISPAKVTSDGINIKDVKKAKGKIVYVTPSHQFPTGAVMPISKRLELLSWADENNGYIIEDDYDGEFRFKGKPVPSLQGLDNNDRVIYLGSFSKSFIPSMRLSYMVLPNSLLEIYQSQYKIYEQPVPRIIQKAFEIFINEGHWEKHLKKSRVLYKKKQEILLESINKYFKGKAKVLGADSGLHILLEIDTDNTEAELIERAVKKSVKVNPTLNCWINPPKKSKPIIFIGYAGIPIDDISMGIKILSEALLV